MFLCTIPRVEAKIFNGDALGLFLSKHPSHTAKKGNDRPRTQSEFEWNPDRRGGIELTNSGKPLVKSAPWQLKKQNDIKRTYLGQIEFDPANVKSFKRMIKAISSISDKCAVVITPINPQFLTMQQVMRQKSGHLQKFLETLKAEFDLPVLDNTSCNFIPQDFRDINHLGSWSGAQKFSKYLAEFSHKILSEKDRKKMVKG
jgi:hypothetical protein